MVGSHFTSLSLFLPTGAGLLHESDTYFAALTAYREGDIEPVGERVAGSAIFVSRLTLIRHARLQAITALDEFADEARRG